MTIKQPRSHEAIVNPDGTAKSGFYKYLRGLILDVLIDYGLIDATITAKVAAAAAGLKTTVSDTLTKATTYEVTAAVAINSVAQMKQQTENAQIAAQSQSASIAAQQTRLLASLEQRIAVLEAQIY